MYYNTVTTLFPTEIPSIIRESIDIVPFCELLETEAVAFDLSFAAISNYMQLNKINQIHRMTML